MDIMRDLLLLQQMHERKSGVWRFTVGSRFRFVFFRVIRGLIFIVSKTDPRNQTKEDENHTPDSLICLRGRQARDRFG